MYIRIIKINLIHFKMPSELRIKMYREIEKEYFDMIAQGYAKQFTLDKLSTKYYTSIASIRKYCDLPAADRRAKGITTGHK